MDPKVLESFFLGPPKKYLIYGSPHLLLGTLPWPTVGNLRLVILGLLWDYISIIWGLYWGYIGIMEKKMEAIYGLGFRVVQCTMQTSTHGKGLRKPSRQLRMLLTS